MFVWFACGDSSLALFGCVVVVVVCCVVVWHCVCLCFGVFGLVCR